MTDLKEKLANLSATKLAFLSQKNEGQIYLLKSEPIAVISVACRLPGGSNSPEAYWQMLESGKHGIKEVPGDRWDIEKYYDPEPLKTGKMQGKEAAFLDDIDQFDPQFFGITPREVLNLDPQQRLLLEASYSIRPFPLAVPHLFYSTSLKPWRLSVAATILGLPIAWLTNY